MQPPVSISVAPMGVIAEDDAEDTGISDHPEGLQIDTRPVMPRGSSKDATSTTSDRHGIELAARRSDGGQLSPPGTVPDASPSVTSPTTIAVSTGTSRHSLTDNDTKHHASFHNRAAPDVSGDTVISVLSEAQAPANLASSAHVSFDVEQPPHDKPSKDVGRAKQFQGAGESRRNVFNKSAGVARFRSAHLHFRPEDGHSKEVCSDIGV